MGMTKNRHIAAAAALAIIAAGEAASDFGGPFRMAGGATGRYQIPEKLLPKPAGTKRKRNGNKAAKKAAKRQKMRERGK